MGPQAPCSGFGITFSSNSTTAYQQGRNEASAAWNTVWQTLHVGNLAARTPITYDLEAFDGSKCNAMAAASAFIQGWVDQLHNPVGQLAGVYGSTCGSYLDGYAALRPFPDFIWGAVWDGSESTSIMSCVNSDHWWAQQRLKQYVGGHSETWNGVTLDIDTDCANGPVAPNGTSRDGGCR